MDELTKGLNKAARGLLGWSVKDQSEKAEIALDTLRSFETGRTRRLSRENEGTAIKAFEAHGLTFVPENGGGAGVRYSSPDGDVTQ